MILKYINRYTRFNAEDIIVLKEYFNCDIVKNKHIIDLYHSDSIIYSLYPQSIYYNETLDMFIIHGVDTSNRDIRIYYDKTKFRILNTRFQYRFQNDKLIFIPSDRTIGWGWFNSSFSINMYTDMKLLTTDTVFIFPGRVGLLANYEPISFDVINGKWIFEWIYNVYVQNVKINGSIKHFTFIDKKEFYFYQTDITGYGIFYDGIDYGSIGYDKIIPITTPKTKVEFIAKKGVIYYKLSII